MKNFVALWFAITLTTLPTLGAQGGIGGGGGSDEADVFRKVAKKVSLTLAGDPSTSRYGLQLLETMNSPLEVVVDDSLEGVCDGKAKGTTNWAYSCQGQIHLLASKWANRPKGEGYLENETQAASQITKIIHEVFRAANPHAKNFESFDGSFGITRGEIIGPVLESIEREARSKVVSAKSAAPVAAPGAADDISGDYFLNLTEDIRSSRNSSFLSTVVRTASYLRIRKLSNTLQVSYCENKAFTQKKVCNLINYASMDQDGANKYGNRFEYIQVVRQGEQAQLILYVSENYTSYYVFPLTKL